MFMLVFVLLYLHMLRNITSVYIILLAIIYFFTFLTCYKNIIKISPLIIFIIFFIVTSILASIHTFFLYDFNSFIISTLRYNFMIPLVFIAYSYLKGDDDYSKVLYFVLIFISIAVFCYPYQYLFGRISWFAEPHERAGIERFSTYLGSLTVNGAAFPLAMIILIHSKIKQYSKFIFFSILMIGAFFSLQKSAIVGVILVLIYLCISYLRKLSLRRIISLLFLIPFIILAIYLIDKCLMALPEWGNFKTYTFYQIGGLLGDQSRVRNIGDVSIGQSIIDRLFGHLVKQSLGWLYESQGMLGYFIGGGYGMLGQALVPGVKSVFYTSHNGYIDFILVGGIFHLLAFLGILSRSMQLLYRAYKVSIFLKSEYNGLYLGGFYLLTLLGIQTMFAGGVTFQPIIGGLFWLLVSFALKYELESNRVSKA